LEFFSKFPFHPDILEVLVLMLTTAILGPLLTECFAPLRKKMSIPSMGSSLKHRSAVRAAL